MITATATSSAENATTSVSVQEAEPKVIVAKTVAADVVKPDTNTQEAESDIIETVVEQPQVAAVAEAVAWYDVLINAIVRFFVELYQWARSLV